MTRQHILDPALNTTPVRIASVHLIGIGGVAMGAISTPGAVLARGRHDHFAEAMPCS